jgi:hypothetical protein
LPPPPLPKIWKNWKKYGKIGKNMEKIAKIWHRGNFRPKIVILKPDVVILDRK